MDPENNNQNYNPVPGADQDPIPAPGNAEIPAIPSQPPAPAHMPGQVITSDGPAPTQPVQIQPDISGIPPVSGMTGQPVPGRRMPSAKAFIIALIAVIVLGGGAAAAYFGYYMNPSVILSQSLSRTGKGYDKLVNYVNQQSQVKYKGSTASGTYSLKSDGFSTDGSLSIKDDGTDTDTTIDIGLAATRANIELRTIKPASSTTPDVYLKASGIKGLGSLLGSSDIDSTLDGLDGKWIVVDHTLIDNIYASAQADPAKLKPPTESQVMDELKAFGDVNQQYVFTTDKKKSVTTVVKKYGTENIDGHKTYHYKMALDKTNLKAYISAQQKALDSSQLGSWIKNNKYPDDVNNYFKDLQSSADKVSSKDDFDLWVDVSKRLVYKVRIPDNSSKNPAVNYADVGLNYKGGSNYPFFINAQSKDSSGLTTGSLVATLNSKDNSLNVKLAFKETGSSASSFNADLIYEPSNNVSKISAPSGAESLSQVLDQLGLGDWVTELQSASSSPSAQPQAKDSKRMVDIQSIQTQLEAFFSEHGYYPSLADMNDASWLSKNMKSLDRGALEDPNGNSQKLSAGPAKGVYAYKVTDSQGKSCEQNDTNCAKYTLTATLSNGTAYTKTNLD